MAVTVMFGGCAGDSDSRPSGTSVVVVGIDGADWKMIDALAADGAMPNLSRLRVAGTSGPIATLDNIALSPVIWTSVATGKTADKHKVTWFMVDQADGGRVPVRSYNRKTKAIWNLLAERQRSAVIVGWWATYPAEEIGPGIMVSDGFGFHGFGSTARDGENARKTYPGSLFEEIEGLMPGERHITEDFLGRFIRVDPDLPEETEAGDPIQLFKQSAATAQGYTAVAEKLLADHPYDLVMVYYEQVDSMSHLFMKYAPPKLSWVEEVDFARYRDVVSEWYKYQDELLGRLLDHIDLERTAVFVLSDHGFKSGERRIRSERTIDVQKAHLDHEPLGIFLAAGPQIRRGVDIQDASVLDITPTLLHYLGLPVADDMDGKVLEGIFETDFIRRYPVSRIASFESEDEQPPEPASELTDELGEEELAERMRALQALGYVGGETGGSSPEIHNNLGQILLGQGKLDEARAEFEEALRLDPRNADALLNMGTVRRIEGRSTEAEHFVKRALQVDPSSIAAIAQLAEIKRDQGDLDESIRLYREALEIDDSQPFVHLGLGDALHRAGRLEDAERAFESVLELNPDSFEAHYNLGVTCSARGLVDEAFARFEKALKLAPDHPDAASALNNIGDLHLRSGDQASAMESFRRAVESSATHIESRYNLASLYLAQGNAGEAITLLEEAAGVQPDHEWVNASLGMAYMQSGRNQDAYRSFLLVRRLYPRNWVAPFGLALLHAGSGQQERARELLDESFRLGGDAARNEARNYPVLKGTGANGP
jgi:tetratricopeptide (TPR) repeat protein